MKVDQGLWRQLNEQCNKQLTMQARFLLYWKLSRLLCDPAKEQLFWNLSWQLSRQLEKTTT